MFTQRSVTGINDNTMVYKACFNQGTVCVTYGSACFFWKRQYYLPVCRQIHTPMSDLKTRVLIMKYLQIDHKPPDRISLVSVAEAVKVTASFKYSVHVFHDKNPKIKESN